MNYRNDLEYNMIVSQILSDKEFNQLKDIKHHDNNRLKHSLRVSYCSYRVAKLLHLNYEEVARGGLLHDFFLERTVDYTKVKDKLKLYTMHAYEALRNANELFVLTPMEQDMI